MAFDASEVAHELVGVLGPVVDRIATRNRDLAGQALRALTSIPLNIDEGRGRMGADQRYHWSVAQGSARELRSVLRVVVALRYVPEDLLSDGLALLDRVLAMLWRLTGGRGPTRGAARSR